MLNSSKQWQTFVQDMLAAINRINARTAGMTLDDFLEHDTTVDLVIRSLGVIGEDVSHIPEDVRLRYPNVEWKRVKATRNFLVHDYRNINNRRVWRMIKEYIPPLHQALVQMLRDNPLSPQTETGILSHEDIRNWRFGYGKYNDSSVVHVIKNGVRTTFFCGKSVDFMRVEIIGAANLPSRTKLCDVCESAFRKAQSGKEGGK